MNCPECDKEIEQVDTAYSNITTERAKPGQHTGDIYFCENCECHWLDNFLNGKIEIYKH